MKMSNQTYDVLNKYHRIVIGLIEILGIVTVIVQALQDNNVIVPVAVTTVIAVAKQVLGYVLHISSKAYWEDKEIENGDNNE